MFSAAFLMIRDESDRKYMEELCKEHSKMMFGAALKVLHNPNDALDAVQNSFVKIIDSLEKIREINSNETRYYLYVVAKNTALDMLRKANSRPESIPMEMLEGMESDFSVEERVLMKIDADRIDTAMKSLPESEYDILYLNIKMNYSPTKIADLLGILPNAARQRIFRAKQSLINKLEKEGITNDV